jgi:hydrogenase maturation protein HypF
MVIRQRIFVRGIVQGIGFRPHVYRLAAEHGLTGFVGNNSEGAFLEVEGPVDAVASFTNQLRALPPPHARFDAFVTTALPVCGKDGFRIVESEGLPAAATPVSPDLAICDECLAELSDPANRRFGYPFLNCTHCGPRFTIVEDIPYDRPFTTMRAFPMCAACEAEYRDPLSRRFHAQPNACWECGPTVWLRERGDGGEAEVREGFVQGTEAIARARALLAEGKIVAVKGIGGYHLACDATNDEALRTLRERKGRVEKPFALMVGSVEIARRFVEIDAEEARLLSGRERPILLLGRRAVPEIAIAPGVAPGNDSLGVMLPYAPLHHLLLGEIPLVMTSANRSDEPIVRTNAEALERLTELADAFLMHNREIHVVCDDSVVRRHRGAELPVRRSRGYAPLPVLLGKAGSSVLATGGELKATFCLTRDEYAFLSQHIGDLDSIETQEAYERAVAHFLTLFRAEPERVACDLHPGYASSEWAKRFAAERGLPVCKVQHHEAHVAALMAEQGVAEGEPFLGVAFDGTGYGHDGAIWGGEFLLWEDARFHRVAHLDYVPLPGGDAAIRHPWRVAVSHLGAAGIAEDSWVPDAVRGGLPVLRQQLARGLNCVPTSSMGRLFDAVAAVLGVRHTVSYEAQAAMELEALCRGTAADRGYRFAMQGEDPIRIGAGPLWAELLADRHRGMEGRQMAARFHAGVAEMVRETAERMREGRGVGRVGLTGGVFQNVLLLELCQQAMERAGFTVFTHRVVPPNDGGIALGQAWLARG